MCFLVKLNILPERKVHDRCSKILTIIEGVFLPISIKGFTDAEANQFIACINKNKINVDKIREISGCNPLLLSFLPCADDLLSYSDCVNSEVKKYLQDNLTIVNHPNTVKEHL